jgi:hypothetical protein
MAQLMKLHLIQLYFVWVYSEQMPMAEIIIHSSFPVLQFPAAPYAGAATSQGDGI